MAIVAQTLRVRVCDRVYDLVGVGGIEDFCFELQQVPRVVRGHRCVPAMYEGGRGGVPVRTQLAILGDQIADSRDPHGRQRFP